MNAIDRAVVFSDALAQALEAVRREMVYQERQIEKWRDEAKRWEKRAQDAEVELNNIRAWVNRSQQTPDAQVVMGEAQAASPASSNYAAALRYPDATGAGSK